MKHSPTSSEPALDLLDAALIRVRLPSGERRSLTLPGLLARLASDDVESFEGLRIHQRAAWHAFLVQIAAMASEGTSTDAPSVDEARWRVALLALSGGNASAWRLVESDVARPAFLQPPVPEGSLDRFETVDTPDGLDVLVTSKNHEGKVDRMRSPLAEHWVYALVSLQTTQGFSGKMNYGVARMNSGFGSRALVGVSPDVGWGARFRRDVRVASSARRGLCDRYGFAERDGARLLWLLPWSGSEAAALPLSRCDPLCVEVCRRVRLVVDDDRVRARTRATEAPRIRRVDGTPSPADPWMPVRAADGAPLTLSEQGLTYAKAQELIFGSDYRPSAAQELHADDGPHPRWTATTLVRGQGRTGGLHSREIPIPPSARRRLASAAGVAALGRLAKEQVERAALVRLKVLRPSILVLLQAAPKRLDFSDDRADRWLARYEALVDERFFATLWNRASASSDDAKWDRELHSAAQSVLRAAIAECPLPSVHRYRAVARAETLFQATSRKHLDERALAPSGGATDAG